MAARPPGGLDPRFPEAYQRGGTDAVAPPVPPATRPATPLLDSAAALPSARAAGPRLPRSAQADASGLAAEHRHFDVIVAGNPWLRSLFLVGSLATAAGFVLTFYAEFAFSVPPASGVYDPSVYVVPRLAEALALPLVIAGVVALVSATALRIVAWRPSGERVIVTAGQQGPAS